MHFVKVEGAGNDYVLVDAFDTPVEDPAALSRRISDRHAGIGADGLLLVGAADGDAVARMRIYNADGSEGRMCGNGLRCVVRWLVETGRAARDAELIVQTASGPRGGRMLDGETAEVSMGVPDFRPAAIPVRAEGDGRMPPELPVPAGLQADPDAGFCVSIGNPHLVVRVPDPVAVDLPRFGAELAVTPALGEGANVHFVRVHGPDRIDARPWELGSGATRACGTGAVAAVAVSRRLGWTAAERTTVCMPGGELDVRWDGEGEAWLAGPARLPFSGEWLDR
ncbi:MAG: diaminopimelate epimerase [Planctomycetota bacterium]|jgi:diaminopimelate epimerase